MKNLIICLFVMCFCNALFGQSYAIGYSVDSAFVPNIHEWTNYGSLHSNNNYFKFNVYKPNNYDNSNSPLLFARYATGSNGADVAGALQPMADARKALVIAASGNNIYINEPIYRSPGDSLDYTNTYPFGGSLGRRIEATEIYKYIYRRVLERESRPSMDSYMIGFSAGAQWVSRYMLLRQAYPDSIPLKMAVSCSAYFYTFPTDSLYGLPMFYLQGLQVENSFYVNGGVQDTLEKKIYHYFKCPEHIKQYYQENYAVMVGAADNANLGDIGNINITQGTNRYDRAKNFYNFAQADAPNYGTTLNWQYYEIPGVGHDQGGMFYTKEVATHTYSIAEHILFDSPYNAVTQLAPVADFISDSSVVTLPTATVSLTNYSRLADSYFWDFGDSTTSTAVNPTHVYTHTGKYIVQLTAKNTAGCENWKAKYYMIQVVGKDATTVTTVTTVTTITTHTTPTDVGINESNEDLIKLQPNPTVDEVLVSFGNSEAKEIEVTTITGEVVYKEELTGRTELKIATKNWSNGMYFVNVNNNKQKLTLKLLVQH